MSYENLRADFYTRLTGFTGDQLARILAALDQAAADYDITQRSHDLTVYGSIPQQVKIYLAAKAVKNLSKNTLSLYRSRLICFFSHVRKPLEEITANDIRIFLYAYQEENGVSVATLDHIRTNLHGFFEWCVQEEYVRRNPCRQVEKVKVPKHNRTALDQLELERVRDACATPREIALVDFLVSSGLRVTECADLLITDLDFADRSVKVRHGKGDKERTTFFSAKSELTLRKYLSTRTDQDPHVFVMDRRPHRGMTKESIEKIVRGLSRRAGIRKKLTPHILRYTFATIQLERGTPLEQVQQLLGHASPQTTLIYAQINLKDLQRNHQKYSA